MTPPEVLVESGHLTAEPSVRARPLPAMHVAVGQVIQLAQLSGQLLLLLLVIRNFQLAPGAWEVLKLAAVGFVLHALLPLRYRLPFFILLSMAAVVRLLGWAGGAQLLSIGLLLIVICHLSVSWLVRVGLLVAVGGVLALGRSALVPMPVGAAVWPILGSMFMFRLMIYMYDVKHDPKMATWSGALSYFFMLPNVAFPFFPVVDYKTFRRCHYEADAATTYQKGMSWMLRGIIHLILYRFVYYYLTLSPEEVQTSAQLTRFVVANYALYLRVSGSFHLIVGLLHLFGFNLPLTNNLYFLASSFTDYWRRVNIYWKDFMLKLFYYPSYFWLRRFGPITALVLSTVVVFVATTVLHSYQWFWLRGDWYMSPMDAAFWSVLGVLVIGNVVWEAKRGRRRSLGAGEWSLRQAAGRAVRTVVTFTILASLWSLWSAPSIAEWTGMWSVWNIGSPFTIVTGVGFAMIVSVLVFGDYMGSRTSLGRWLRQLRSPTPRGSAVLVVTTLLTLLAISDARARRLVDSTFLLVVEDLQKERLSRTDQEQLERGYYENLFTAGRNNAELAKRYGQDSTGWVSLWQTRAVLETDDLRRLELVPNTSMLYKGRQFTINSFGMRDRERTQTPAPGTYRFAVLGASTTMGSGVGDDQSYPILVESMFGAQAEPAAVEMMNFAVESYNAVEQVAVVDDLVPQFAPHGLVYIAHETEFEKTVNTLALLVESRTDLVYDELRDIVAMADVQAGMPRTIALRRLGPYRDAIMSWAYRRIAEEARTRDILPVWAFIPMPVPGTGPCPPGSAQIFCFGNLARAGAAADASDPRVQDLVELAREAGFVILDLSTVYGDVDLKSLWIAPADGHPNVAGHELIANGLYSALSGNSQIMQDINRINQGSH